MLRRSLVSKKAEQDGSNPSGLSSRGSSGLSLELQPLSVSPHDKNEKIEVKTSEDFQFSLL